MAESPLPSSSSSSSSPHARLLLVALSAHPWDGELSPAVSGALDAFVAECRGDGDPPERVLLKLKAIVAEIRGPQSGRRPVSLAEQAFKERLVRHCIESYYARPDDQGS